MKIKRLEIFGFKSFKDCFTLNFNSDLIGIVGPNGCGKSNIIDALRWVLGESHARQLRGNVQEDMIFNGSETSKAMGMAEVSVTFETTPGWVPAIGEEIDPTEIKLLQSLDASSHDEWSDGVEVSKKTEEEIRGTFFQVPGIFEASEIQITRRLYRSGETECLINKVSCRLKDIVDLCRTIGLGARGLNIVQQGTIGEIITRKPIERRELLEEAAGISGFRSRLETALRQLARTQDNIARLRDLYEEVGKQVKSLKRQAARAKARAEQKEQLRVLDFKLYSTRLNNLKNRKSEAEQRISEIDNEQAVIQKSIEACQKDYSTVLSEDTKLDSAMSKLREERQSIRRELETLKEEEHALEVELAKLETRLRAVENGYLQIEERKQGITSDLNRRLELISSLETKIAETRNKKAEAEAALLQMQQQTMSPGTTNESLASAQYAGEIAELNTRVERLGGLNEDGTTRGGLTQEIVDLSASIDKLRKGLRVERDALSEERVKLAALEAEVSSLKSQLQALSEHVVRAVADKSISGSAKSEVGNVLLAGMHVPPSLQRAVAAVMADRSQFLVTGDAWDLLNDYKTRLGNTQTNKTKPSQTKLGIIDSKVKGELTLLGDEERSVAPTVRHLVNEFSVTSECVGPISMLLGHVLLVDSLLEAQKLRDFFSQIGWQGRLIVTLDGEVICPWGWYTTCGDGAGLSLALRLKEQQEKVEIIKVQFDNCSLEVKKKETELAALDKEHRTKEEEKKLLIQDQRRLSQLLQFVREAERRERNEALDKERLAQKQARDIGENLTGLQSRIENEKRRVGELEAEKDELARRRGRLADGENQLKVEHAELSNKMATARNDDTGAQNIAQFTQQLLKKEQALTELENSRRASRETLAVKTKEVESLRNTLERINRDTNSLRLEVEKGDVESHMLCEEFKRYYGEDSVVPESVEIPEDEIAKGLQAALREWQDKSMRIRRILEKEGEVDPEVVSRYEEEQKRHDTLTAQLKDLEQSVMILEKTTKYLKEISRLRFIKTFQFVSQKFAELIPRLFGGGMGKMELVNPEDPLSSGVELTLRPPGKALKSLELLSGGEKALAAIAVLVSMFLHRPGPICVMDEVDAPLDDANLGKFMELVREISSTTQFLVITHNKQTMSVVDRLIGITMQEKGVSTAMEVSFAEAEVELERISQ